MTHRHGVVSVVQTTRLMAECKCGERHQAVAVGTIPTCDVCKHQTHRSTLAIADGATSHGPWANMCAAHVDSIGRGFGTGAGQLLVRDHLDLFWAVADDGSTLVAVETTREAPRSIHSMTVDEIEDMVGDGDIASYL